jgi:hypothetical protein
LAICSNAAPLSLLELWQSINKQHDIMYTKMAVTAEIRNVNLRNQVRGMIASMFSGWSVAGTEDSVCLCSYTIKLRALSWSAEVKFLHLSDMYEE